MEPEAGAAAGAGEQQLGAPPEAQQQAEVLPHTNGVHLGQAGAAAELDKDFDDDEMSEAALAREERVVVSGPTSAGSGLTADRSQKPPAAAAGCGLLVAGTGWCLQAVGQRAEAGCRGHPTCHRRAHRRHPPLQVKFLVPNVAAGSIIGKAGANITEIQTQSSARMQVGQ